MDEKIIAELVAGLIASGMIGGLSGSMPDPTKKPDFDKFKAEAEAKREEARAKAKTFMAKYNAERAKALYDAFVQVGFSEVQAFELLKETFILER